MSTLTIIVTATNPDSEDRRGMEFAIDEENAHRATLIPPIAPLLKSTAAERNASYRTILAAIDARVHAANIQRANDSVLNDEQFKLIKPLWKDASPAQRSAALAALSTP